MRDDRGLRAKKTSGVGERDGVEYSVSKRAIPVHRANSTRNFSNASFIKTAEGNVVVAVLHGNFIGEK